jgi:hypothetical protein
VLVDDEMALAMGWNNAVEAIGESIFQKVEPPSIPQEMIVEYTIIGAVGKLPYQFIDFGMFGTKGHLYRTSLLTRVVTLMGFALAGACAVSPELQAKMDEYQRTIPTCSSSPECQSKWNMAIAWVESNSDYGIRSATGERMVSTTNVASDSVTALI